MKNTPGPAEELYYSLLLSPITGTQYATEGVRDPIIERIHYRLAGCIDAIEQVFIAFRRFDDLHDIDEYLGFPGPVADFLDTLHLSVSDFRDPNRSLLDILNASRKVKMLQLQFELALRLVATQALDQQPKYYFDQTDLQIELTYSEKSQQEERVIVEENI